MSSVASLAIAFLRKHASEATSVVIADAIDCEVHVIAGSLQAHVKSGGILLRKEGRLNFYKLDAGYAPKARNGHSNGSVPGDEPPDDDEPAQRVVKAKETVALGKRGRNSVFDHGIALTPPDNRAAAFVRGDKGAVEATPALAAHPSAWKRTLKAAKAKPWSEPIDLAAVKIKTGVPLRRFTTETPHGKQYIALVRKMKVGDCVELPHSQANGLRAFGRKPGGGFKVALRRIDDVRACVWLLSKSE